MADSIDQTPEEQAKPRKGLGKIGWSLVSVLGLALGGGGFFATYSGLLAMPGGAVAEAQKTPMIDGQGPVFLELDPMMISVGHAGSIRQLRFRAYLQLSAKNESVAALQPRILDVFSTYLRAVSVDRLEDPTALLDLRAQLLRRVQLLTGPEAVKDLLIIDFVIT